MKVMERNVMRLVAVQHLRSAYGIKTKNWNKNKAVSCKVTTGPSVKVFGVPLENLPQYHVEHGSVPSFLVDACMTLLAHVDTEGLFRKSGSIVRLKALRAKLDAGEDDCLTAALPCDVAGLVKQFFRELPEPVLCTELHEAFLKARQLPTEVDRTAATMLLSCVLPDRNLSTLRHFFHFLQNVSQRSAENKMDSSNLSVILAPNLLHSGDGNEKMNANTEKRLKLQAAVVHCFIENAQDFGVLPQFLMEKVPTMMGCEGGVLSPSTDGLELLDTNSGMKRRRRRSFGVFSSATPVIGTPSSKRKLPLESGQSIGFSNKKRRSIKKNLGIESLPNALFGGTSTPGSAYSASGILDFSQNALSSVGRSSRQPATSARRKSRRLSSSRHAVNRVESGRAGCFSPKASKKDPPRKSLRLRFSLGKTKDAGSESIGWRLATQESTSSIRFHKDAEFSPTVLRNKSEAKSSKYISKSEDNLLTPQCDLSAHRTSWSGETPDRGQAFDGASFTDTPMSMCLKNNYYSEPAIIVSKPPTGANLPKKLCCASSAESLESETSFTEAKTQAGPTLLKIKKDFTESGNDLKTIVQDHNETAVPLERLLMPPPETPSLKVLSGTVERSSCPPQQRHLAEDQNITFGQIEIVPLSPLYIDSALFDSVSLSPRVKDPDGSLCAVAAASSQSISGVEETETEHEQANCSRLIDALDIQSPANFKLGVSAGLQSTPYRSGFEHSDELNTPPPEVATKPAMVHEPVTASPEVSAKAQGQPLSPGTKESLRPRVADHIQHFNRLTLYSPKRSKAKQGVSPLRFQRTPVRQSVRRINSLLGDNRRPTVAKDLSIPNGPVLKAVSLESGLSTELQPYRGEESAGCPNTGIRAVKKPPPVPPKNRETLARKAKACALGDVTNMVQPKAKVDTPAPLNKTEPVGGQKSVAQQVADKDVCRYRGSPRNPLNQGRLLSAMKPIDL